MPLLPRTVGTPVRSAKARAWFESLSAVIVLIIILLLLGPASLPAFARTPPAVVDEPSTVIDLSTNDPDLLVSGNEAMGSLGVDLVTADVNGDNIDDLIIGAPRASRDGVASSAGNVYVFFGGRERQMPLPAADADVIIVGANAADHTGGGIDRYPGVLAVGDVNNDRFEDLVIGVPDADGPGGEPRAGEARIIFGRNQDEWGKTPVIDLAATSAAVTIETAELNCGLGTSVAIGDVNGDGIGDVVVGAPRADVRDGEGTNRMYAGKVMAFYGRETWPNRLLASADADLALGGPQQFGYLGIGLAVGQLGGSESSDIVMGAHGGTGPSGDRPRAGEVYIVFGSGSLGGERNLAETPADWTVHGAEVLDKVGRFLAVGDVSGDAHPDLVIGIPYGDGPGNDRMDAGEVVVLLGPKSAGTSTDLADGADFILYGPQGLTAKNSGGNLGDKVIIGDFNGDDVGDIAAGAREGDGADDNVAMAGEAYVVFGGNLPARLDLDTQTADIAIYGRKAEDHLGRLAAGNLDGAGPDDLALGAYNADVNGNLEEAGEVYVFYREASGHTAPPSPTPTVTPTATPTPDPEQTSTVFEYLPLIIRNR